MIDTGASLLSSPLKSDFIDSIKHSPPNSTVSGSSKKAQIKGIDKVE